MVGDEPSTMSHRSKDGLVYYNSVWPSFACFVQALPSLYYPPLTPYRGKIHVSTSPPSLSPTLSISLSRTHSIPYLKKA